MLVNVATIFVRISEEARHERLIAGIGGARVFVIAVPVVFTTVGHLFSETFFRGKVTGSHRTSVSIIARGIEVRRTFNTFPLHANGPLHAIRIFVAAGCEGGMGTVSAFIGDTKIQCAGALIGAVNRGGTTPFHRIDFHITGPQCLNAKIDGTWIVIIAILSHFTAIWNLLMNAHSLNAAIHGAGVSLNAIGVRFTVCTLPLYAD